MKHFFIFELKVLLIETTLKLKMLTQHTRDVEIIKAFRKSKNAVVGKLSKNNFRAIDM